MPLPAELKMKLSKMAGFNWSMPKPPAAGSAMKPQQPAAVQPSKPQPNYNSPLTAHGADKPPATGYSASYSPGGNSARSAYSPASGYQASYQQAKPWEPDSRAFQALSPEDRAETARLSHDPNWWRHRPQGAEVNPVNIALGAIGLGGPILGAAAAGSGAVRAGLSKLGPVGRMLGSGSASASPGLGLATDVGADVVIPGGFEAARRAVNWWNGEKSPPSANYFHNPQQWAHEYYDPKASTAANTLAMASDLPRFFLNAPTDAVNTWKDQKAFDAAMQDYRQAYAGLNMGQRAQVARWGDLSPTDPRTSTAHYTDLAHRIRQLQRQPSI